MPDLKLQHQKAGKMASNVICTIQHTANRQESPMLQNNWVAVLTIAKIAQIFLINF